MPRYTILPANMKLYSPAEPKGRMFLKGEPWPGDAWSEKPGGDDVGRATASQALKDLEAAKTQADDLRRVIASGEHDRAQLAAELAQAKAALAGARQAKADAEKARAEAEDIAREATKERDEARGEAQKAKAALERLTAKTPAKAA